MIQTLNPWVLLTCHTSTITPYLGPAMKSTGPVLLFREFVGDEIRIPSFVWIISEKPSKKKAPGTLNNLCMDHGK